MLILAKNIESEPSSNNLSVLQAFSRQYPMCTASFIACKMFFNSCHVVYLHYNAISHMIFNTTQLTVKLCAPTPACDVLKNIWKDWKILVMQIQHLTSVEKHLTSNETSCWRWKLTRKIFQCKYVYVLMVNIFQFYWIILRHVLQAFYSVSYDNKWLYHFFLYFKLCPYV